MKSHYDLLAIERTASAEDVKRAFRREIARYHPDKVQHLGHEFQEIAATRAAELTEAYRILMDVELRQSYDESLDAGGARPAAQPPPSPQQHVTHVPPPPPSTGTSAEPPPTGARDTRFQQERVTTSEFLRRVLLEKLRDAVQVAGGESTTANGFDAAYHFKGRRGLFAKAEPAVKLLLRVVSTVDPSAVAEAWMPAARAASGEEVTCLLLMGNGLASARELASAIAEQRRRSRHAGAVVIPVDMRDWEALFPPDTPSVVRTLLDRLRSGQ